MLFNAHFCLTEILFFSFFFSDPIQSPKIGTMSTLIATTSKFHQLMKSEVLYHSGHT